LKDIGLEHAVTIQGVFFDIQEMLSLGLPSVFCGTSENVDSVKFINSVYHLVKRHLSADASYRELSDRFNDILIAFCVITALQQSLSLTVIHCVLLFANIPLHHILFSSNTLTNVLSFVYNSSATVQITYSLKFAISEVFVYVYSSSEGMRQDVI